MIKEVRRNPACSDALSSVVDMFESMREEEKLEFYIK